MALVGYFTIALKPFGKNYPDGKNKEIIGAELLELAWNVIEEMQYMGGGMVVFLEANDEESLLSFYRDNKFRQFDTRQTASGTAALSKI